MILKRLGIGKKSEYFLEAEPLSSEEMKAHTVTDAVSVPVKPSVASETSAVETKKKKSKKVKADESATPSSTTPAPQASPKPASKPAPKPEPTSVNFATENYLFQTNTPRRRPGPSLDMFKTMAKQINSQK